MVSPNHISWSLYWTRWWGFPLCFVIRQDRPWQRKHICIFSMLEEALDIISTPLTIQGLIGRLWEQSLSFRAAAKSRWLLPQMYVSPLHRQSMLVYIACTQGWVPHTDTVTGRRRVQLPCRRTGTKKPQQHLSTHTKTKFEYKHAQTCAHTLQYRMWKHESIAHIHTKTHLQ